MTFYWARTGPQDKSFKGERDNNCKEALNKDGEKVYIEAQHYVMELINEYWEHFKPIFRTDPNLEYPTGTPLTKQSLQKELHPKVGAYLTSNPTLKDWKGVLRYQPFVTKQLGIQNVHCSEI